jgi:hypothetical protein
MNIQHIPQIKHLDSGNFLLLVLVPLKEKKWRCELLKNWYHYLKNSFVLKDRLKGKSF